MKTQRKIVTYVTPNSPDIECMGAFNRLVTEEQIEFQLKNSIVELFPLMGDPKFKTDLIIIDAEKMQDVNGTSLFDIINTLSTLIKCTVQRSKPGKPEKRTTVISVSVGTDTDLTLIKDLAGMVDIAGISPRANQVSYDEFKLAITELMAGHRHVPKTISNLLRSKRKKTTVDTDGIKLTPRQSQILQIVTDRGASNKVIARMLNISESTVKLHMGAILKKFGVRNRTQLAIFNRRNKDDKVQAAH